MATTDEAWPSRGRVCLPFQWPERRTRQTVKLTTKRTLLSLPPGHTVPAEGQTLFCRLRPAGGRSYAAAGASEGQTSTEQGLGTRDKVGSSPRGPEQPPTVPSSLAEILLCLRMKTSVLRVHPNPNPLKVAASSFEAGRAAMDPESMPPPTAHFRWAESQE